MIVISKEEYSELKEQIKKELIEEQRSRPESFYSICQKEQSAIFQRFFPKGEFENIQNRYWKIRQVVSTMTNVLRPRETPYPDCALSRGADVHSEAELDASIKTFELVCKAARDAYCPDIWPGRDGK